MKLTLPILFLLAGLHLVWAASLYINASQTLSRTPLMWNTTTTTYRAAVYEHVPIQQDDVQVVLSRQKALAIMKKNLAIYDKQTQLASKQGAKIIVFPEDGLFGFDHTRKSIRPYLENIPDPNERIWNPCDDPKIFPGTDIQHALSCMAKAHGIYVVVNMGDLKICCHVSDRKCPPDGEYHFNTNVVYDPSGNHVARYHKYYLYYEPGFDVPPTHEISFFDTPFGRVGTFICADILYRSPAVDLIKEYHIKHIVFPTAWQTTLPYVTAVSTQQGFAMATGVNLLASNTQTLKFDLGGSGIFSGEDTLKYVYNTRTDSGTLLVADLPVNPEKSILDANNRNKTIHDNTPGASFGTGSRNVSTHHRPFKADMLGDEVTFVLLTDTQGKVRVCNGSLCCSLKYKFHRKDPDEIYALGAWQGLHTFNIRIYNQMCSVVRCKNSKKSSCGKVAKTATSTFDRFILEGTFEAEMVYPYVLAVDGSQIDLAPGEWRYAYGKITSESGFRKPLLSATLYGRYFSKDP